MTSNLSIHNERGSVFVYILLAVALFAALSYAVSRDKGGSNNIFTEEQAKIAAQEIIEYGNTIAAAVQKLRLRGCKDTEISFANNAYKTHGGTIAYPDGHNPNAPTDGTCDVFKPEGGNIMPLTYPENATVAWPSIGAANSARGSSRIRVSEVAGNGDADKEEIILTGAYIRDEVCLKMNEILGITNPAGQVPETTVAVFDLYAGSFDDDDSRYMLDDDNAFAGKQAFCTRHPTGNAWDNFNVQVLMVR